MAARAVWVGDVDVRGRRLRYYVADQAPRGEARPLDPVDLAAAVLFPAETREAIERALDKARDATNLEPSEAQKESGRYRKGRVKIHGLDIAIENPAGSVRSGPQWATFMRHDYGYFTKSEGADGEGVDVIIGPRPELPMAVVIDQVDRDGRFDEHKCIIGVRSLDEGRAVYLGNYAAGWTGFGAATLMSIDALKGWLKDGDTTKPLAFSLKAEFDEGEVERHPAGSPEGGQFAPEGGGSTGGGKAEPPAAEADAAIRAELPTDHDLGNAAWADTERGEIVTVHVTDDPDTLIAAIRKGDIGSDRDVHRELGRGVYGSATPQLWMNRSEHKWDFLKTLDEPGRQKLGAALNDKVAKQVESRYITKSEGESATRYVDDYVKSGFPDAITMVAGQPYNVEFWKGSFLKPLGIDAAPEPRQVTLRLAGKFKRFDNQPTEDEVEAARAAGYDGAWLRSGMFTVPQMVVWKAGAIRSAEVDGAEVYSPSGDRGRAGGFDGDSEAVAPGWRDHVTEESYERARLPAARRERLDALREKKWEDQTEAEKDEFSEILGETREFGVAWKRAVDAAVSAGELLPEDAKRYGRIGDSTWREVDSAATHALTQGTGGGKWEPLPNRLYHVTTNVDAVLEHGLKTRAELGDTSGGAGLGGGTSEAISFTDDPKTASAIRDAMLEARAVIRNEWTVEDIIENAAFWHSLDEVMRGVTGHPWTGKQPLDLKFKKITTTDIVGDEWPDQGEYGKRMPGPLPADKIPAGWIPDETRVVERDGQKLYFAAWRPRTEAELEEKRWELWKATAYWREHHGGPMDPLFFTNDRAALARVDPNQIKILRASPAENAKGTRMSGLGEWRTYAGRATPWLDVVDLDADGTVKAAWAINTVEDIRAYRSISADWDEALHPRGGDPENPGRFSESGGTSITTGDPNAEGLGGGRGGSGGIELGERYVGALARVNADKDWTWRGDIKSDIDQAESWFYEGADGTKGWSKEQVRAAERDYIAGVIAHHVEAGQLSPLRVAGKLAEGLFVAPDHVVEIDKDGDVSISEKREWVADADVETYFPTYEDDWNRDFWSSPGPLYHATSEENAAEIIKGGLEARNETRGMYNRGVGHAVFTTSEPSEADEGSYGDTVIEIDTVKMKADGFMPFASEEPSISEGELRGGLASAVGLDEYYNEDAATDGVSLYTVILGGDIPAKYLRIAEGNDLRGWSPSTISARVIRAYATLKGEFDEDLHPRDDDGKFAEGGGGGSPATSKQSYAIEHDPKRVISEHNGAMVGAPGWVERPKGATDAEGARYSRWQIAVAEFRGDDNAADARAMFAALKSRGVPVYDAEIHENKRGSLVAFVMPALEERDLNLADPRTSPAFAKWFEGSKAVADDGRPLVLFHGTQAAWTEFDPELSRRGYGESLLFLTPDPELASDYASETSAAHRRAQMDRDDAGSAYVDKTQETRQAAGLPPWTDFDHDDGMAIEMNEAVEAGTITPEQYDEWSKVADAYYDAERTVDTIALRDHDLGDAPSGGAQVMPLYASLKNPVEIDMEHFGESATWDFVMPIVVAQMKREGRDGAIVRNVHDAPTMAGMEKSSTVVIVTKPTQVKSAIGNRGTYDPDDPDISADAEWDEALHPRGGDPANPGRFSESPGSGGGDATTKTPTTAEMPPARERRASTAIPRPPTTLRDHIYSKRDKADAYRQLVMVGDHDAKLKGAAASGAFEHLGSSASVEKLLDAYEKFSGEKITLPPAAEAKARVDSKAAELIGRAKVGVRVPLGKLSAIVADGRLKTQFETKTSRGDYDPEARAAAELDAFGIAKDAGPGARPIYGYAFDDLDDYRYSIGGRIGVANYGDVTLVLKDAARARSTFAAGDTLFEYDAKFRQARLAKHADEDADEKRFMPTPIVGGEAALGFDVFQQRDILAADSIDDLSVQHGAVEAHVHGGVKLSDIERVVVHYDQGSFNEFDADPVQKLTAAGIPVEIVHDQMPSPQHETRDPIPPEWLDWLKTNAPGATVRYLHEAEANKKREAQESFLKSISMGMKMKLGEPQPAEAGGTYGKPTTSTIAEAQATLAYQSRDIIGLPHERGVGLDANGAPVFTKDGGKSSIEIDDADGERMRDGFFVHNHPGGRSLSSGDIGFAAKFNLREMSAVGRTPVGPVLYRMARTGDAWPWKDNVEFNREYQDVDDGVYRDLYPRIGKGEISMDQANAIHHHVVNELFAKRFGLRYEVIPLT